MRDMQLAREETKYNTDSQRVNMMHIAIGFCPREGRDFSMERL